MSVLSHISIEEYLASGRLVINPAPIKINPDSIEFTLGNEFIHFQETRQTEIDIRKKMLEGPNEIPVRTVIDKPEDGFVIYPNTLYLATTLEYVEMPDDLILKIEGKSTVGRYGLVPVTAGVIDPGFHGQITLEIFSLNKLPVVVYPGMCIAQGIFTKLDRPAKITYGDKKLRSRYFGQKGVTLPDPSNLFLPGWRERVQTYRKVK